ncbi:MAG: hypothetical protein PVG66_08770 [Chromatiales bacterium]|jgi:hypothetical protein
MNDHKKILALVSSVILPVLGILVPITIYMLSDNEKSLSYEILGQYQLVNDELDISDIEIKYLGNTIQNLELTSLRIFNSGEVPIKADDFEREIKITFSDGSKIYSIKKKASIPKNLAPSIKFENNKLFISPLLLNSSDSFVIDIILSGKNTSVEFDARVVGISSISGESVLKQKQKRKEFENVLNIIALTSSSFIYAIVSLFYAAPLIRRKAAFLSKSEILLVVAFSLCSVGPLFLVVARESGLVMPLNFALYVFIPIFLVTFYGAFVRSNHMDSG